MATQPIAFSFTIDNFVIWQTRSRHEDTDFVSSTLQLKNADGSLAPSQALSKAMGNVNNGTHEVNLTFPNVLVSPGQTVLWSYSIVNAGNAPPSKVTAGLETVGNQLINLVLKAEIGGAAGSLLGIAGTIAGTVVGLIAGALEGLLTANCDGPVAAEAGSFTYDDLVANTNSTPPASRYLLATNHPGIKSPAGCGENSSYRVNWHIDQGPYTFWGGEPVAVTINKGGPPVHLR